MVIAHSFVFQELQSLISPDRLRTKAFFGTKAIYVDEKIIFVLRHKDDRDDGVWVALSDPAHVRSISNDFPTMRNIEMFQKRAFNDWLLLPELEEAFEEGALALCQLIAKGDTRLGKVPAPRRKKKRA